MKSVIFLLVLAVGLVFFSALYFASLEEREIGFVERVIDGDTLELNTSEKVRLTGINAPEKGESYYDEARKKMERLVLNKEVSMEKDKEGTDKYGRLLRYVYIGDEMVNLLMIEEGYATVYVLQPNNRHERLFRDAESAARSTRKGVWSLVSEDRCSECIRVDRFNWDAEGNDCINPNGEWVAFSNTCHFDCEITGWSVKDAGTSVYTFHDFVLKTKKSVTLFSGSGKDNSCEIFWDKGGSCPAVWNNDGDTLYLRDGEGKLVLREAYG